MVETFKIYRKLYEISNIEDPTSGQLHRSILVDLRIGTTQSACEYSEQTLAAVTLLLLLFM